jgi:hypothetical protein
MTQDIIGFEGFKKGKSSMLILDITDLKSVGN